jgi:hypothetical protein
MQSILQFAPLARCSRGLLRRALEATAWLLPVLLLAAPAAARSGQGMSELHLQHGRIKIPSFAGGGYVRTRILTLQHAHRWDRLELFGFLDLVDAADSGFNHRERYGELYLAGRIGAPFRSGPLRSAGWIVGINRGERSGVLKYLPGVRLSWNVPGFNFVRTDLTAYLDDNTGLGGGGVPREDASFMFDLGFSRSFSVGSQSFSLSGHAEFIGGRRNEQGRELKPWVLAQPQLRWDAGKAWWGKPGRLQLGFEYQYWRNKLGDPHTRESALLMLFVVSI